MLFGKEIKSDERGSPPATKNSLGDISEKKLWIIHMFGTES